MWLGRSETASSSFRFWFNEFVGSLPSWSRPPSADTVIVARANGFALEVSWRNATSIGHDDRPRRRGGSWCFQRNVFRTRRTAAGAGAADRGLDYGSDQRGADARG